MHIQQDIDKDLALLHKVAMRMDALFTIPGTRITVGLDNIIGLLPVVGDLLSIGPSIWMINRARLMGATPGTLAYMSLNTALDFVIGSIPVFGDIFDVLYNANLRNYAALETNLNRRAARAKEVGETRLTAEVLA
ncbi:MAG: DUF4112 domain-containing protein [Pseudomonadota bacterium]